MNNVSMLITYLITNSLMCKLIGKIINQIHRQLIILKELGMIKKHSSLPLEHCLLAPHSLLTAAKSPSLK